MNTKYSRRKAMLLLLSISCLGVAIRGQAQTAIPPVGPIRLESTSPFYTLRRIDIADTQPAEHVWILQIGARENAYKSLSAVSLRVFVSRLPKGTSIICTTASHHDPITAITTNGSSDAEIESFIVYCRACNIHFTFGSSF